MKLDMLDMATKTVSMPPAPTNSSSVQVSTPSEQMSRVDKLKLHSKNCKYSTAILQNTSNSQAQSKVCCPSGVYRFVLDNNDSQRLGNLICVFVSYPFSIVAFC